MGDFSLSDLRTIVTSISFVVFIGIVWWAYGKRQKKRFDEAANLPFADAELPDEISSAATAIHRNRGDVK